MTDMQEGLNLAKELGPLPAPHLCRLSQLEPDLKLLHEKNDNMIGLMHETRERLENGYPRWIFAAVAKRVESHGGVGAYTRKFHQGPFEAGDVQEMIRFWAWEVVR